MYYYGATLCELRYYEIQHLTIKMNGKTRRFDQTSIIFN